MALSPLSRRAGVLSLTAAVLIVLSQIMRLATSAARSGLGDDAGVHRDLQPRPARDGQPAEVAIGWIGYPLCRNSQPAHGTPPDARQSASSRCVVVQQSRRTAMKPSRLLAVRFLVAVACGIASAVLGSMSAAADDGPDLAAIDRYVRSEMDAQRIPGLALGIVHGDRIVHVQGFGQADRSGRAGDPADAVPDRFGDQVVHRAGHHAAERGGPAATGRAGAALPTVVAGRRSGRVDPGHGPPSAVPGQRAVEGDGQRVRDQRGHSRLRPRGPGPGAARRRTHRSRWARPGSTATPTTGPWA